MRSRDRPPPADLRHRFCAGRTEGRFGGPHGGIAGGDAAGGRSAPHSVSAGRACTAGPGRRVHQRVAEAVSEGGGAQQCSPVGAVPGWWATGWRRRSLRDAARSSTCRRRAVHGWWITGWRRPLLRDAAPQHLPVGGRGRVVDHGVAQGVPAPRRAPADRARTADRSAPRAASDGRSAPPSAPVDVVEIAPSHWCPSPRNGHYPPAQHPQRSGSLDERHAVACLRWWGRA